MIMDTESGVAEELSIAPHQFRPGDLLVRENEVIKSVGAVFYIGEFRIPKRTIVTESGQYVVKREGEQCRVLRRS